MDRLESDRMFAAVMELGSFAAAAARLGTSSGQASKLVARLEGDLGVRLLNRTTRALSPTEAGQAYFDRVRRILEDIDELDREVRSAARVPKGHLRVTAPLSYGRAGLLPALNAFAKAFPEVELDVQFTDRMVNLVDEGFDVAVRVGRPADSSLVARKLGEVTLDLVAAPAYLAQAGEPQHPRDLVRHACILDTNMREPTLWRFSAGGRTLTVNVTGRIRYSNAEACLAAAEEGLGLALVPGFLSGPSLAAGRVVRLLEVFAEGRLGVHLLYPPGRHLAAKVRAFIDFMAQNFRAGHG